MDADLMAVLEAAATAAAAQESQETQAQGNSAQPLPSPEVKSEVKTEVKDEPTSPEAVLPSPLKRSRSPNDENEKKDEKRQKTEADADVPMAPSETENTTADVQEIMRMIEMAQQSVPKPDVDGDHQMNGTTHDGLNGTSGDLDQALDINGILASIDNNQNSALQGDILEHGLPAGDLPIAPQATPRKTIWTNPLLYTRQTHMLPTLGKVAVDILRSLSENSLEDTIGTLNDPESEIAKEYTALRSFFDVMRKQFSDDFPLLYADQLGITSPEDREIIRIANLATTCASMFGTNELGFPDLESSFISTFVPFEQQMSTDVAELYLGLKTQMFLTLLEGEQTKPREQILDDLFVTGIEEALKSHHPTLPLASSETDFISNAQARKAMLLNESGDPVNIQALSQQFVYESYLDVVSTWMNDNMSVIETLGSSPTSSSLASNNMNLFDDEFDIEAAIAAATQAAHNAVGNARDPIGNTGDLATLAPRASDLLTSQASNSAIPSATVSSDGKPIHAREQTYHAVQPNQHHPTAVPNSNSSQVLNGHQPTSQPQSSAQSQQQYYPYSQQGHHNASQNNQGLDGVDLPPGQSHSSELLYERARQAAAARSSTHARREGSHSTRRPWSPDEEKALMMGLDMVKGPHWSQILGLFGQQGRISNILADRTQVQLKDKARNLKLFFLKTNSEMPYYLQCVTGELKTRAPTQAARKEAEERAKMSSDGDKAHVNGIMALGNMQSGNAPRVTPNPTPQRSIAPGQTASQPQLHPGQSPSQQQRHTLSQPPAPGSGTQQLAQYANAVSRSQAPPVSQPQSQQARQPHQAASQQPHAQAQAHHAGPAPIHAKQPQSQGSQTPQGTTQRGDQSQPPMQLQPRAQVQSQPQAQSASQSQASAPSRSNPPSSQQSTSGSSAPAKIENTRTSKDESEEAGILELKRLIDQETNLAARASPSNGAAES